MTENNMEVVAWRIYDAVTDAKSLADEYEKDGWQVEPLVTLSSAQAEIEQLTKERDAFREQMSASMDALILARQSLEWFTERYQTDDEITAHRIHLRRVASALRAKE